MAVVFEISQGFLNDLSAGCPRLFPRQIILELDSDRLDDLPVGNLIEKLLIVSSAVSNTDNRCLGKLFDRGAQLFAHFPEKRLLPALRRRTHINGVQTIAVPVRQANLTESH